MGKQYEQLKPEERATVMLMRREGSSLRAVARTLRRSPSSISRELARHGVEGDRSYDAVVAGQRARARRFQRRRERKLAPDTVWFGVVEHFLREGWSPKQPVSQPSGAAGVDETIYNALYVLPRGELRAGLLGCLRQGRSGRKRSEAVLPRPYRRHDQPARATAGGRGPPNSRKGA
jgi:IS30 family transposase